MKPKFWKLLTTPTTRPLIQPAASSLRRRSSADVSKMQTPQRPTTPTTPKRKLQSTFACLAEMRSQDTSLNPNSNYEQEKCYEYEYEYNMKTKNQAARASSTRCGRGKHGHAAATVRSCASSRSFFLHLLFLTHVLLRSNSKTESSSQTLQSLSIQL